jgi:hypothetical protein
MEGIFWSSTHPGGDSNTVVVVSFIPYFGNVLKDVIAGQTSCSYSARCVH